MNKAKRKAIIAGNWKMNKTATEAAALIGELVPAVKNAGCEVVICTPFTSLCKAVELCRGTNIHVGAENVHFEKSGAFTGEISAGMLVDLGVEYVIVGHSERRQYFAETDETVNKRAKAALAAGLNVIVCVGESLAQREQGVTEELVRMQTKIALQGVSAEEMQRVVIAYEPVWAIGTGRTATSEQAAIASMTEAERTAYFASNPGAEALSGLGTLNAADFNPTTSSGMENLAKLGSYDSGQVASYLSSSSRKPNVDQTSGSTDSQKANGVELALALSGDDYRVDIGSTPLGQDLNTVVGGVKWSPKLTNYLSLILTGERRSLTDSLLSYVGLKDAYSGKTWGQVTKNGGTLQLSYDDGDAGFYVGGGGYSYLGQNVASNTSINANAGVYLRPYHDEYRQLQAGLSMSYMDYSKNLSYFTYGQGGYFSPQNYVSVSLPVSLTEKYDNWTMKLGGSVGYQSYSQDKSAYFPTNSEWQQTLETAVSNGFAKEAYYSATSKSGIGYTLRAGADYKVNKQMTLGGQIGYDTFGDYNESTAGLYIRYMLGDH